MSGSLSAQSQAQSLRYFDTTFYLNSNPDVLAAVAAGRTTAFAHFSSFGAKENRSPTSLFNANTYLASNSDIALAVGSGRIQSGWDHFVNVGIVEGRSNGGFTGTFNTVAYLAANPDVAAAVSGTNPSFRSAYEHFLLFGSNEGRPAFNTAGEAISIRPGSTFTLTTGVDNFTGTNGNDTFNAVVDVVGANSTLTAVDVINGGPGVDTLSVTTVGAGATAIPNGASVTGIEIVSVRNTDAGGTATVNATGLTSVIANGGVGGVTVTNFAAGNTFQANATTGGAMTVGYVAGATQASLSFSSATTGAVAVTGAGLTSAVINTTGTANTVGGMNLATANAVTINAGSNITTGVIAVAPAVANNATLTVLGAAASVNVGVLDTDFITVNASGLTAGGLTATIGNLAVNLTGGAGNDVITTAGVLTGTVNAGVGAADRLIVATSADIDVTIGTRYTGFEVLQANNGVSVNAAHVAGITSLIVNGGAGATGFTNVSSTQAGSVQLLAAAAGDVTVAVTGAANVGQIDSVVLTVSDNAAAVNTIALAGRLVLANIENLTINAVDNFVLGSALSTAGGAPNLQSLTLNGSGTQSITLGAGTVTNFTVNGSAATGALTVDATAYTVAVSLTGGSGADVLTGSGLADIINGGAGNDVILGLAGNDAINGGDGNDNITGGAGVDALTGGAGVDTFVYTTLADSVTAGFDSVLDFVAGTDKFDVTVVPVSVFQGAQFNAAGTGVLATDIQTALTAGGQAAIAASQVAVVTITGTGAGTFMVINDVAANFDPLLDGVVRITGLTGTLSVADFV